MKGVSLLAMLSCRCEKLVFPEGVRDLSTSTGILFLFYSSGREGVTGPDLGALDSYERGLMQGTPSL